MLSKNKACYCILKHHGLLVSCEGALPETLKTRRKRGETFGQWKARVLGPDAHDVVVYQPIDVHPRTLVKTLREQGAGEHAREVLKALEREKDAEKRKAVETLEHDKDAERKRAVVAEREMARRQFRTTPREILARVVLGVTDELEPSVLELLKTFLDARQANIDTADLMRELILCCNRSVRAAREQMDIAKAPAARLKVVAS